VAAKLSTAAQQRSSEPPLRPSGADAACDPHTYCRVVVTAISSAPREWEHLGREFASIGDHSHKCEINGIECVVEDRQFSSAKLLVTTIKRVIYVKTLVASCSNNNEIPTRAIATEASGGLCMELVRAQIRLRG
jgi:hypothetical protein